MLDQIIQFANKNKCTVTFKPVNWGCSCEVERQQMKRIGVGNDCKSAFLKVQARYEKKGRESCYKQVKNG